MTTRSAVWLVAAVALLVAVLGSSPVAAQPGRPGWDVEIVTPDESDGEIVLTLSFFRPGRVMYRTVPGSARSPEDYAAVSGETVFAGGDSRTIRIPIVNDGLAESASDSYEEFIVEAWEEPAPDPWPGGAVVRVRIIDDDYVETTGDSATGVTVTTSRPSTAAPVAPASSGGGELTAPPTTATSPAVELATELASEELRPGTGFELPLEESSASPTSNDEDRGGAATSRLAPVLGATALGVGGVAWVQRRRRWSATRS